MMAEGSDSNYNLTGNSTVLVMNPAKILPGFNVYSAGVNPLYASSVPVLQGQLLANKNAAGDIYTYTWPQLISEALLDKESIAVEHRVYLGMGYDTDFADKRITVDSLKYCPFELDAPVKELSQTISGVKNQLGFVLGKELFTDSNLQETEDMTLFEKRGDTLSEHHEPIYVEWDYSSEESNNQALNVAPQTLLIPVEFLDNAQEEPVAEYDIPALATQQKKAENLKTDLEKLLDELTFTA